VFRALSHAWGMNTSHSHRRLPPIEKQAVREQAIRLYREGMSAAAIAERYRVSRQIVHRWIRKRKEDGSRALRAKKVGRPALLSDRQLTRLAKMLVQGPLAHGFQTQLWTLARIGELVERQFGVSYHPRSLSPLLHRLGFSCQKPEKRANERDEEAIENWVSKQWPKVKKKGAGRA
jgi:transposase